MKACGMHDKAIATRISRDRNGDVSASIIVVMKFLFIVVRWICAVFPRVCLGFRDILPQCGEIARSLSL